MALQFLYPGVEMRGPLRFSIPDAFYARLNFPKYQGRKVQMFVTLRS
jgi:hypothetical protein